MGVIKKAIKPMFKRGKWNIVRGDSVKVLAGKDKGQVGTVTKVIRDTRIPRVLVDGLNLNKRHTKGQGDNPGGIFPVEAPLHYSNVALVDPVTKAAVRVSRRYLEDGTKVRVTRGKLASASVVPRPEILTQRRRIAPLRGPKDTPREVVERVTHDAEQPNASLSGFGAAREYSTSTFGVDRNLSSEITTLAMHNVRKHLPQRRSSILTHGFAASSLFSRWT